MYNVTIKIEKWFEYIIKEKSNNIEKEKIRNKIRWWVDYIINNNKWPWKYWVLVDIEKTEDTWFEDKLTSSKTTDEEKIWFTIIIKDV